MNLAGPKSRAVLRKLTTLDLSNEAFPYLALREAEVAGVPARLMRVGFVGELGYEIHVPADRAAHLWDALMEAGQDHDIRPFGVEAQRLLRLEKGHIIIGQDTDGLTQPDEAGLEWAVKMDKPFFVGKRSVEIVRKRGRAAEAGRLRARPGRRDHGPARVPSRHPQRHHRRPRDERRVERHARASTWGSRSSLPT